MPRRSVAHQLIRQFDASPWPIYLVDSSRTIVYCNEACAEWVCKAAEELIGQICIYGSPPSDGINAVAARLCPSPEALAGNPALGQVSAVTDDGRLVFRVARFLPLGEAGTSGTVLAIVDVVDSVDDPNVASQQTADQLHRELERLRRRFAGRYALDRLFGSSPAATRVRAQVALASLGSANVVIVGPPGSGREHVAKAIHYRHQRESEGNLVPIACSALDPELLTSTLDAVFRANQRRPSVDTLLLGEVDQLPREVQAELVRLLRLGVPVRVIATARRSLDELVTNDMFRPDLAAMLSTLVIELPPLADRLEDLPLLAQSFVEEFNAQGGRQLSGFTAEALDQLSGYHWPGNLDEFAQMVREACDQAVGTEITPRDLPKKIHLAADAAAMPPRVVESIDLEQFMARVETELIERAMRLAKGNKTRAAELLGMTRPRLYRRLVQLGLAGQDEIDFLE